MTIVYKDGRKERIKAFAVKKQDNFVIFYNSHGEVIKKIALKDVLEIYLLD